MARCSICHTQLDPAEDRVACAECGQEYHRACWTGIGGCATYGCRAAAEPQKAPVLPAVTGWGDEKTCPACGKRIVSSVLVCRCGARFPWADPMTPEEYRSWLEDEATRRSTRRLLLVLFFLSITGFLAPPCGAVAGVVAWRRRRRLAGAAGIYLAVGWGAAALGVAYAFVVLALVAGG
ncbi:MAG: hypothetical protein HY905_02050 [Deltaproteobacteria bacterium]|nr:hypothetical protein [Deltaproteobacteria bacterium]